MFHIKSADKSSLLLDIYKRSEYDFRTLAAKVSTEPSANRLIRLSSAQLDHKIVPGAFWHDKGDIEGDTYLPYIARHPDFELMLRSEVAMRLKRASKLLPADWRLVVKAAYRPMSVQSQVFDVFRDKLASDHPGWTKQEVLKATRIFVVDPKITTPPHCTGAAFDVDVIDRREKAVDMGCAPNTGDERSYTHFDRLSSQQISHRKTLLHAMLDAGFANLVHEWWHYSYGDQYWAAFYGKHEAIYGIIDEETI